MRYSCQKYKSRHKVRTSVFFFCEQGRERRGRCVYEMKECNEKRRTNPMKNREQDRELVLQTSGESLWTKRLVRIKTYGWHIIRRCFKYYDLLLLVSEGCKSFHPIRYLSVFYAPLTFVTFYEETWQVSHHCVCVRQLRNTVRVEFKLKLTTYFNKSNAYSSSKKVAKSNEAKAVKHQHARLSCARRVSFHDFSTLTHLLSAWALACVFSFSFFFELSFIIF